MILPLFIIGYSLIWCRRGNEPYNFCLAVDQPQRLYYSIKIKYVEA